jgi:hypothetical protein
LSDVEDGARFDACCEEGEGQDCDYGFHVLGFGISVSKDMPIRTMLNMWWLRVACFRKFSCCGRYFHLWNRLAFGGNR